MRRVLIIAVLCLSVCTFALAQRTHIAWDHNADFAGFHTYAWQPSPSPAKGDWNQAIVEEIDKQLQAKGLTKVDSNPDLWVVYTRSIKKDESSVLGGGYVIGPGWGSGEAGIPPTSTTFEEGTLVVELADPKTKQVLWRGAVSNTISDNSNKNLKNLDKSVAKLFEKYPPKSAK